MWYFEKTEVDDTCCHTFRHGIFVIAFSDSRYFLISYKREEDIQNSICGFPHTLSTTWRKRETEKKRQANKP